jgi:hypothetical protein
MPGFFSPGVKTPNRAADHSPPFSADAKNTSSWTGAYITKSRGNFTYDFTKWLKRAVFMYFNNLIS